MKKLLWGTLIVLLTVCLTACTSKNHTKEISRALSVDVSSGKEVRYRDSHGGFHGDGTTYIVLAFSDGTVLEQIKDNAAWTALPLHETAQALVYGVQDETSQIGPYLKEENGNALFPKSKTAILF